MKIDWNRVTMTYPAQKVTAAEADKRLRNFIPELWAGCIKKEFENYQIYLNTFYDRVERKWIERWFTLPWRPFVKHKLIMKEHIDIRKDVVKIADLKWDNELKC